MAVALENFCKFACRISQKNLRGLDVIFLKCMLAEAKKCWPESLPRPRFFSLSENPEILSDSHYDLIVVCSVLHHLKPEEHFQTLEKLYNSLNSGGRLVIFEHNPYHPITQLVVKTTPIDANEKLVSQIRLRRFLLDAGFQNMNTRYLLFGPTQLEITFPHFFQRVMSRLPLGGQYVLVGEKG